MTSEDYLLLDIDLFEGADFIRDVSQIEGDDDVSLLNSDIISISSFDQSSFGENSSPLIYLGTLSERRSLLVDDSIDSIDLDSDHTSRNNDSTVSAIYNQPYIVHGAEIFPSILADACNRGDMSYANTIIATYISDKCMFRIVKPTYVKEDFGFASVIDFYSSIFEKCPDSVILVRSVKKMPAKNGYYLKFKLNQSGTIIDPIETFGTADSITVFASPKISKTNLDAIRVAEALIKQQKKLMHAFFRGSCHMFVNETTHKIDCYEMSMNLTSIKAFEG